ncbi:DHHA1 domain-containing protein [Archaeoglobus sp.]
MKELLSRASAIAAEIASQEEVLIVTHIDADGITSGAIAHIALERLGIENRLKFVKQLDESEIESIRDENVFVWFTDLGSGQIDLLDGIEFVITDHHVPQRAHPRQLNPHEFGYDGTVELSGSGTTYLVAKFLRKSSNLLDFVNGNADMLPLAIVGAVGDLQDSRWGKLQGINRLIAKEGLKLGNLDIVRDLRFFGKQTRPVAKMLEYNSDPFIPGLTGNERGVLELLSNLEIEPWMRWIDLSMEERRRVVSAIVNLAMEYKLPYTSILRIVGESYILLQEPEGTEKRDAMEFSTLLNATARYGEADVGLGVCLGDENACRRARTLLQNHRRNLSNGIRFVDENGIEEMRYLRYFHAGSNIPDTIVGIVAGMCFHKGDREKPIVAFAESDRGIKVSARATYKLVEKGIHLAKAMRKAAEAVGGAGGGHSVAAGATIPEGKEEEFLKILDDIIGRQLQKQ